MSTLTNCPVCKKQVSTEAVTCPHCGQVLHPSKSENAFNLNDPVHVVGAIVALIILFIVIAYALS